MTVAGQLNEGDAEHVAEPRLGIVRRAAKLAARLDADGPARKLHELRIGVKRADNSTTAGAVPVDSIIWAVSATDAVTQATQIAVQT